MTPLSQRPDVRQIYEETLGKLTEVLRKYDVHPGDAASMLVNIAVDTLVITGVSKFAISEGFLAILRRKFGLEPAGPEDVRFQGHMAYTNKSGKD
jgi:hypothetical protein